MRRAAWRRHLVWMVVVGTLSTAASVAPPRAQPARPSTARPNIVVILADDLGYGDLASYGHPTHRTPHLDAMAREGVRATAGYAPSPSCSPTRASLLTGRYAFRVGVRAPYAPRAEGGLRAAEHVTLPQVLRAQGYRTMAVGKWHLGDRPGMRPLDHAFDRFVGMLYSHDYRDPWVQTPERLALWDGETRRVEEPDPATLTATYTREAVAFIRAEAKAGRPFFLYLAHSMPHVPLAVSPAFAGRTSSLYGDVISEIDDSVGQVRAALAEAGVAEQTLVVFTSDNGPWNAMPERMFGRDLVKPWDHGSPGLFRGGKAGTYEGGHRVPFLAVWPGTHPSALPAGRVVDDPVSVVDLFPTIAARAGVSSRVPAAVDGRDVWPALAGTAPLPERALLYDNLGQAEAIRVGPWKLRVSRAPAGPVQAGAASTGAAPASAAGSAAASERAAERQERSERLELFHLLHDPSERYDQSASHPALAAQLRARLAEENARRAPVVR